MSERDIPWQEMLDKALTVPGSLGNTYSRLYNYSYGNLMLLMLQGIEPQPVATYKRWQALGRQVLKGSVAREIIRPITIVQKDEATGDVQRRFTKFKPVRCIFPISDTTGDELPPYVPPSWSKDQALTELDITEVPFADFDGNSMGYSIDRRFAVSVLSPHPAKTMFHEVSHIVSGHTTGEKRAAYSTHRGVMEFEAEASAHLVMNELEAMTPDAASESRGYLQHWLRGERPPDTSVRTVFKTTDSILRAGRLVSVDQLELEV